MILGTIQGKTTTNEFEFVAKEEPKNLEYVQVYHKVYDFVLCQVVEVIKYPDKTIAQCQVIGYKKDGRVMKPRIPFETGSEVLRAEDELIKEVIDIQTNEDDKGFIGMLEGREIKVSLDLNKILTKHLAVLAKSGAGKSYAVGVLLEEIAEKKVPVIVIDPHGEYSGLGKENDDEKDKEKLAILGLEPKSYEVAEYGDPKLNPGIKPLLLSPRLTAQEITHLYPGKLTATQQAILYSALKNLNEITFESLLYELENEESPAKYSIIATIDHLRGTRLFSPAATPYSELVKPGRISIINLRGINPEIQEIIVYKLTKDLFQLRKQNKISPFFLVIEEAHNYCPERSFGETKASKIIRDVASEGRKFGLGLCVVSQRPARVDKNVLSQCSTQIILKVTNPNDIKALTASIEGLTSASEKEIQHLPIGTAIITGITDVPLLVRIRPRRTKHGGTAINVLKFNEKKEEENILEAVNEFQEKEIMPVIKPTITEKDIMLMSDEPIIIRTILTPAYQFLCREKDQQYKIIVEMVGGRIVVDKDKGIMKKIPNIKELTRKELRLIKTLYEKGGMSWEEISKTQGTITPEQDYSRIMEKGYIKDEGLIKLNEEYLFSRLSKAANHDEISYEEIKYDIKENPAVDVDTIKEILSTLTIIEDQRECWLVRYETIKKNQ